MIKDKQTLLNRLHVAADAIVVTIAYLLACVFQFVVLPNPIVPLTWWDYIKFLAYIIPVYLALYAIFHLYQPKRVMGRRLEIANIVKANLVGLALHVAILYILRYEHFSRQILFAWFPIINTAGMVLERILARCALRYARRSGFNQKHILVVGYSRAAEGFITRVWANPQWGYKIQGILDDTLEKGACYKKIPVIGTLNDLEPLLAGNQLDEIVITLSLNEYSKLERIVTVCEKSGVHTKFVPDYNNIIPTKPYTEDLLGMPVVHIRHVPLLGLGNRLMKRTMDIVGSLLAIILFSPVMLVTAVLIKATSKGPLIYCQERVGLHNRPFKMYKFRSMEVQKPQDEKSKWTTPGDPRVTKVGKVIRKTSIDELPQLFNVLKGEMSLVGPRPERPFFVEKFKEEIPRYMIKHQVRPGITGWAQVNGYRGDTSIRKRIDCDLYYIENWTLGFDFKILVLTVFKGFINKNAY